MSGWTERDVLRALPIAERVARNGDGPAAFAGVATDTRALPDGSLFVALRGEHFDAHDFLPAAAEAGARAAVVERVPQGAPRLTYYQVPDTLVALGKLARYRRRGMAAPVCAITGTNGKTTTKEMVRAVLGTRYRVHATAGNLNNLVGAPLTILAAAEDAQALVVEIGTNAFGEIARLAEIVEPDLAVITSVGEGHLEGFGNVEGVLREKTSLLSRLRAGGTAFVADEPQALVERARSLTRDVRVAGWTARADADLRATDVRMDDAGAIHFRWQGRNVVLPFGGRAHVRNALLALGVGLALDVDADDAVAVLGGLQPPKMRAQVLRMGLLTVLADCYNANPASLAAALDTLMAIPARGGRVAVVGTMLELGNESVRLHREAARKLAQAGLDLIVATGAFADAFEPLAGELGERLVRPGDVMDAAGVLLQRLRGDEVVLLKGSRGVALERLIPPLEAAWGAADTEAGA
ncbi:MAG TPA: UDP-N-acetylmuramoyl-tripeptide--D-alanyl-D-alanine ligase [Longimicrobiales bacterium]|nr:UDP-N-acetylmuramoyl-tripeptide--D-alanyl-D-alanine ligase [Longimicrobiales bacterium]